MANQETQRAEISKSRSKKKPFKVRTIAENGEPVGSAQLVTTRINAKKNLRASLKIFHGTKVLVIDISGLYPTKYWLYPDGLQESFS